MESPKDSPFMVEIQRLHDHQVAALRSGDRDAIDEAAEAFTLFMRYAKAGRLAEYFARDRSDR